MGRRSREKRLVTEINITPFTDVILVLLVIFMITTPLIYQTSIQIKLPEIASGGRPIGSENRLNIIVTDSGKIYLDKELLSEKELDEKVGAVYKSNPNIRVFLHADRSVKFRHIARILDSLIAIGVRNLNIAAITEQNNQ